MLSIKDLTVNVDDKQILSGLNLEVKARSLDKTIKKKDTLLYAKKDVTKHIKIIKKEFDKNLCDDKALTHIKESAIYIYNLRRQTSIQ